MNKIKRPLLESEIKRLRGKISRRIGVNIAKMCSGEGGKKWTQIEIEKQTGVRRTRLSEMANYDRNNKPQSLQDIKKLIMGGVITMEEISELELSSEELEYVKKKFSYLEHPLMRELEEVEDLDEMLKMVKIIKERKLKVEDLE